MSDSEEVHVPVINQKKCIIRRDKKIIRNFSTNFFSPCELKISISVYLK